MIEQTIHSDANMDIVISEKIWQIAPKKNFSWTINKCSIRQLNELFVTLFGTIYRLDEHAKTNIHKYTYNTEKYDFIECVSHLWRTYDELWNIISNNNSNNLVTKTWLTNEFKDLK